MTAAAARPIGRPICACSIASTRATGTNHSQKDKGDTLMLDKPAKIQSAIPFDADRLDRLMDEAGIDILCATSKHNVQYLLGGHRAFFFESMDPMGVSRYLPVLVYPKGNRQKAGYFGHRMESYQKENEPFWVCEAQTDCSGSVDSMAKAI